MHSKIRILPERLANMIAAGEVVSRPASVVKELMENSLDAGATDIRVEVRYGGKRSIRVIDNGEGMGRDDALLCLEQHATSKLASEEDLLNISSMGFRGEAVAAIASVSRMRLSTKTREAPLGTTVICEGGALKNVAEAGLPVGTDMLIENLFYNTPARRKFLKSPETELGHIVDVFNQLAVPHPKVRFDLTSNDKPLLRIPPSETIAERISILLGEEAKRNMISVEGESGFLRAHGFVSNPPYSRASTRNIYTYINERFVKDRLISHAVLESYRGRLLKGRYPVVALFLEMPPHRVDVNVHPAKAEVRFREPSRVHDGITQILRRSLSESGAAPGETMEEGSAYLPGAVSGHQQNIEGAIRTFGERNMGRTAPAPSPYLPHIPNRPTFPQAAVHPATERPGDEMEKISTPDLGGTGPLRYIGQINNSYLVCQSQSGMVLVDQHAAHERVLFEKFRQAATSGEAPSQSLLFPVTVEMSAKETTALEKVLPELQKLGIGIEHFGQNAFVIKSLPRKLDETQCRELVAEIGEELANYGKTGKLDDFIDETISLMACKAAIKAGDPLSEAEVEEILTGLTGTKIPQHCPHGRPIFRTFTAEDLERFFLRR